MPDAEMPALVFTSPQFLTIPGYDVWMNDSMDEYRYLKVCIGGDVLSGESFCIERWRAGVVDSDHIHLDCYSTLD